MSAPFAQAWAVLKAEAYINTRSDAHQSTLKPIVEGGMHSPKGTFISSLPRYQQPRPDGPNYRRGGSVPRNWDEKHGNQRFTGVNVAEQWKNLRDENPTVDEEELQDSFADKFAIASAHEDVHGLTDAEIGTWAAHAVGGFPADLAAINFSIPTNRVEDWHTLRNLAHEYGAYSLTEPEAKKRKMGLYHFAPYLTGEKDISELHSGSR